LVLAAAVIGVSVAGLVTLNAFLAQASFRVDDLEGRVGGLAEQYQTLTRQTAHLSAPGRIAGWAERHGMRLPDAGDLHVLHVPGAGPVAPAGDADPLDRSSEELKPIVVGGG
jgi:hypothetical protein